ncbi:MAG: hypothetical protein HRU19_17170 [Pseudobacteriovorax sp.]|nr:hypothetical protein [Pseudobacteriovorax sp.]
MLRITLLTLTCLSSLLASSSLLADVRCAGRINKVTMIPGSGIDVSFEGRSGQYGLCRYNEPHCNAWLSSVLTAKATGSVVNIWYHGGGQCNTTNVSSYEKGPHNPAVTKVFF